MDVSLFASQLAVAPHAQDSVPATAPHIAKPSASAARKPFASVLRAIRDEHPSTNATNDAKPAAAQSRQTEDGTPARRPDRQNAETTDQAAEETARDSSQEAASESSSEEGDPMRQPDADTGAPEPHVHPAVQGWMASLVHTAANSSAMQRADGTGAPLQAVTEPASTEEAGSSEAPPSTTVLVPSPRSEAPLLVSQPAAPSHDKTAPDPSHSPAGPADVSMAEWERPLKDGGDAPLDQPHDAQATAPPSIGTNSEEAEQRLQRPREFPAPSAAPLKTHEPSITVTGDGRQHEAPPVGDQGQAVQRQDVPHASPPDDADQKPWVRPEADFRHARPPQMTWQPASFDSSWSASAQDFTGEPDEGDGSKLKQEGAGLPRAEAAADPLPLSTGSPAAHGAPPATGRPAASVPAPAAMAMRDAPADGAAPGAPRAVVLEVAQADLGRINVRVAVTHDVVHTHFSADRSEVGQFLVNGQDRLQAALQSNGFDMGQFRVDIDRQGAGRSFQQGSWQEGGRSGHGQSEQQDARHGQAQAQERSLGRRGVLNLVA